METLVKGGFRKTLAIRIKNFEITDAESIEFTFKQKMKASAPALKTAVWVNGAETEDVYTTPGVENVIFVRMSQEDTSQFKSAAPFFLDTRINVRDSFDNPNTPIVSVDTDNTLFKEGG